MERADRHGNIFRCGRVSPVHTVEKSSFKQLLRIFDEIPTAFSLILLQDSHSCSVLVGKRESKAGS